MKRIPQVQRTHRRMRQAHGCQVSLEKTDLGRPFHPMSERPAVADEITKSSAICMPRPHPKKWPSHSAAHLLFVSVD